MVVKIHSGLDFISICALLDTQIRAVIKRSVKGTKFFVEEHTGRSLNSDLDFLKKILCYSFDKIVNLQ